MAENVLHPTVDDGSYLDLGIERDDTPAEKQEQEDAEYLEIAKVTIAYSRASEEELNLACGRFEFLDLWGLQEMPRGPSRSRRVF